jgi:hypothetical protein
MYWAFDLDLSQSDISFVRRSGSSQVWSLADVSSGTGYGPSCPTTCLCRGQSRSLVGKCCIVCQSRMPKPEAEDINPNIEDANVAEDDISLYQVSHHCVKSSPVV